MCNLRRVFDEFYRGENTTSVNDDAPVEGPFYAGHCGLQATERRIYFGRSEESEEKKRHPNFFLLLDSKQNVLKE